MSVVLDPTLNTSDEGPSSPSAATFAPRVNAQPVAPARPEPVANDTQKSIAVPSLLQASVTFRRDAAGQVYYVLTDTQSGKELRQVPPEEIRNVREGIAEYLKQEEAKAHPHVEAKA